MRQFSQFYKTLDSEEKNRNWRYFLVQCRRWARYARVAAITGSKFCIEKEEKKSEEKNRRLRRPLLLAELSAYFWLDCLNFKSAELSLAELSGAKFFFFMSKIKIFFLISFGYGVFEFVIFSSVAHITHCPAWSVVSSHSKRVPWQRNFLHYTSAWNIWFCRRR